MSKLIFSPMLILAFASIGVAQDRDWPIGGITQLIDLALGNVCVSLGEGLSVG